MFTRSTLFGAAAALTMTVAAAAMAQTSANPPGTAASRALDRAAGTDTSGAYPQQADGTPSNPRGTVVSRAAHRVKRKVQQATH